MEKLKSPRSSGRVQKSRSSKHKCKLQKMIEKRWAKSKLNDTTNEEPIASTSGVRPSYEEVTNTSGVKSNTQQFVPMSKTTPRFKLDSTASERKMGAFCDLKERTVSKRDVPNYVIVHKSIWEELFKNLACGKCGEHAITFEVKQQFSYAAEFEVKCSMCKTCHARTFSSPKVGDSSLFDVNTRMVEAFLNIGKGCTAMEKFSITLGMNDMDTKTFAKYLQELSTEGKELKKAIMSLARKAVREAHIEVDPSLKDRDVLNIAVSYDGTWQKRGHTSIYGIGFVVDILTGLVIDYEVLSKYCQNCTSTIKSLGKNSPEYAVWFEGHANQCERNHWGSSNIMEMDAAVILWTRSESECKMRYTTLLSDGDSKTFLRLQKLNAYGDDVKLEKEECINHVAKRLGTGLRNAVKEWRAKKVTLGGRKKGSLKEETIVKLTNYYRAAIKQNIPNLEQMKTAVFATLSHCMSTNQAPKHSKCPGGPNSWCFFNRAIAREDPSPCHSMMKTTLRESVVAKILPVYQRLASDQLLSRCCRGKTQNSNESLHSIVWSKCPKEVFVSKKRIDLAVVAAVSEFNMGCVTAIEVKSAVTSKTVSACSRDIGHKRDIRRLTQSRKRKDTRVRLARKYLDRVKAAAENARKNVEGLTYGGGQF